MSKQSKRKELLKSIKRKIEENFTFDEPKIRCIVRDSYREGNAGNQMLIGYKGSSINNSKLQYRSNSKIEIEAYNKKDELIIFVRLRAKRQSDEKKFKISRNQTDPPEELLKYVIKDKSKLVNKIL
jgi:hypothetical protein